MTKSDVIRISTGFLNTVDDANPGGFDAQGVGLAPGQLGEIFSFKANDLKSGLASVTLFGGEYQYVQFKSGSTAAPARGLLLYWSDYENFIVTPDAPTSGAQIAGICLGANTKGNYGFMQISGKASVQFRAAITKVAVADDLVVATVSANTADVLADATGIVSPNLKLVIGVAIAAPVNNTITTVYLRTFGRVS